MLSAYSDFLPWSMWVNSKVVMKGFVEGPNLQGYLTNRCGEKNTTVTKKKSFVGSKHSLEIKIKGFSSFLG